MSSSSPPKSKTASQLTDSGRQSEHFVAAAYSGPLPPPEFLRQYDDVCPGAAERILRNMEEESQHRRRCEAALIDSEVTRQREEARSNQFGQICAFLIATFGMAAGLWILLTVPTTVGAIGGTILGGGPVVAIVTAFLKRRTESETVEDSESIPEEPNNRKAPRSRNRP